MTDTNAQALGLDGDDPTAAFREAREYARGELDVDHHDVHPIAGLVDDEQTRRMLMWLAEVYDPTDADGQLLTDESGEAAPRSFWDTLPAREGVRAAATEKLTAAVQQGNITQTAYLAGAPSYQSDVSGLHAINQLADWLVHSEQCKLIYLAALMGRGKTDLSLTMFEVIHDHYQRVERSLKEQGEDEAAAAVPEPEFAANFHCETPSDVDAEVREFNREQAFLEWAEQGSSADERWFIFDEASTELTAQSGANAQKVAEKMAPFVKKMRKLGINMIVIGHDKGDVHVAIRSLADFVDKQGLKSASFYAGINEREPQGHLFDLDGIPPTSWDFNTDDMATWQWMDDEDEAEDEGMTDKEFKREVARRGARLWANVEGVTQGDVAEALSTGEISVSRTMISRMADRMGLS
jgi:hypothetical protein